MAITLINNKSRIFLSPRSETSVSAKDVASTPDSRTTAVTASSIDPETWTNFNLDKVDEFAPVTKIYSKGGKNPYLPEFVNLRKFELGGKGSNGISMQFAENLGATPVQITTANGKGLLWSPIVDDNYRRELKGASLTGGIPIVGPAGRTFSVDGKAEIKLHGSTKLSFGDDLLGINGRIPTDANGVMSHGPIFTSQNWKLTSLRTKGDKGRNGIEVTYTLPLNDTSSDKVVDMLVKNIYQIRNQKNDRLKTLPGKIEVKYILEPDHKGCPRFLSDIKIDLGKANIMFLNGLAQHTFLASDENDKLRTNASLEYEAHAGRPELPTGRKIPIQKEHDFSKAREVHKNTAGDLEVILTGYKGGPKATLERANGLNVRIRAGGRYDAMLICNKGKGNLMVEPMAGCPNALNTRHQAKALLPGYGIFSKRLGPLPPERFTYELSLVG